MVASHIKYGILIDGAWDLSDLGKFSRNFSQCYAFLYALSLDKTSNRYKLYQNLFKAYPWRGGWSSVGFFQNCYSTIPLGDRPSILSISYHSPGKITLKSTIKTAAQIATILAGLSSASHMAYSLYHKIHDDLSRKKLLSRDVQEIYLSESEKKLIVKYKKELSLSLGLNELDSLDELTGNDLASLKMMLAFFRRASAAAKPSENNAAIVRFPMPTDE